ncbi:hypothetical protein [Flavobacterium hydatis]|uniref:Uncharacterized protein n=1 Tax=Flavobacterium hydatis TaxID=991 RepID=A0A086AF14_FLAHY|nr:hypothetical protein [Flavobacterium hydatis]KFF15278.1 hypothetical protein IW20_15090 [Flavobacterium hydatis]OXA93046.1 hypothetical protein B0A62_14525 [Flavobacterium hydatis]
MSIPTLEKLNKKLIRKICSSFGLVSKNDLLEESLKYSIKQEKISDQLLSNVDPKDKKAKKDAYEQAINESYKGIGVMDFMNTLK